MDAASPVHGIVAERAGDGVIGIANYIIHENTWTLTPVCYLQDLFVDPQQRAAGVGQQLIDWLVAEMTGQGWSRLYWHTRENNTARAAFTTNTRRIAAFCDTSSIIRRLVARRVGNMGKAPLLTARTYLCVTNVASLLLEHTRQHHAPSQFCGPVSSCVVTDRLPNPAHARD